MRIATGLVILFAIMANADERQLTVSPKHHNLDNNDNFSPDDRFLCYDTREMIGPGIENSQSIEKVEIATGAETVLYAPERTITGAQAAPGVGAVTFSFEAMRVAFIHGPPVDEVDARGYYGKPNRNGAEVVADGSQRRMWLDHRDVATDRDTLPGAHRGGTHRHEYARRGTRIGFTYDDFLLPQYDRTIGYMEAHADAPGEASHWFAVLVRVAPMGASKPGEIEKAYGDSWVTPEGTVRAFIGKVRNDDGETYEESLFAVNVPPDVDITTADAGNAERYPSPPQGVRVRRLTRTWAGGIVRGSVAGDRIAYYAKADDGSTQIFAVPTAGSDAHVNPAMRPRQVTQLPGGAGAGLRWHPSGDYVACISENAVAVTHVASGDTRYLTPRGDGPERLNLVWSRDGATLAFNKAVPHDSGTTMYDGGDPLQIFLVGFEPF